MDKKQNPFKQPQKLRTGKGPTETILTPKEELFCREYLVDFNATQAAIRAGYSKASARTLGLRVLAKDAACAVILQVFNQKKEKIELNIEWVLTHLTEMVQRCMQKKPVMDFNYKTKELTQRQDEHGNNVWQFDSTGGNAALKMLGEYLSMFKKVHASDPDNPLFPPVEIVRKSPPRAGKKRKMPE